MFKPDSAHSNFGDLCVIVEEAKLSRKTSCFVTLCMLTGGQTGKLNTHMKNDSNPVWNEPFTFEHYSPASLKTNTCLDVTVTDWSDNSSIGRFKLGPNTCIVTDHNGCSSDISIWDYILKDRNTWFDIWQSLNEPTKFTMSKSASPFKPPYKKHATSTVHHIDEEAAASKLSSPPPRPQKSCTPVNPFSDEDSSVALTASLQGNKAHNKAGNLLENKPVPPQLQSSQQINRISAASSEMSLYSSKESLYSTLSINGEVMLGVWHKEDKLYIHIAKASNLGLSSESSCNPYVKIYLLPDKDKKTKKKTDVKRNTQNPEYDKTISVSC